MKNIFNNYIMNIVDIFENKPAPNYIPVKNMEDFN